MNSAKMIPGNQAKIHKIILIRNEAPRPFSRKTANGGNRNAGEKLVWNCQVE